LLRGEQNIRIQMQQLDARPYWLNTANGTLDLKTGEFWKHRRADLITKVAGASYDPTATAPRWQAFLDRVVPDRDVQAFLQRSAGIALTDDISEHCIWVLYGTGRNGKSTVLHVLGYVLGDYADATGASTLMVKAHGDEKRDDIAGLRGARFVAASEAEQGQ